MKNICLFIVLLVSTIWVSAQQKMVLMGKPGAKYLMYPVGEKESLSSIGRQFGITASQLAKFNGKSPSALLAKGSMLKVPVTASVLLQNPAVGAMPVYHEAIKGDNLASISKQYHKVSVASLRKWNKLGNGAIKKGNLLVVGYVVMGNTITSKSPDPLPSVTTAVTETKTPVEIAAKKETEKVADKPMIKAESDVATVKPSSYSPTTSDEGFFASVYATHEPSQVQQFRSGDAATFKTISGWTDRKYYVLINDVTPGTVVRITAPNNKSICARVLAPLPDTKGTEGILLRMSNSAASALEMKDITFTVTLTYFE